MPRKPKPKTGRKRMSEDQKRVPFNARIKPSTLERIDQIAAEWNQSRGQVLDDLVTMHGGKP